MLALVETPWHAAWEGSILDSFFQWRGEQDVRDDIVILGINSESMEFFEDEVEKHPELGLLTDWPWPRQVHARLLDRLMEAGARVVAFDVLFLTPSLYGEEDDARFREALSRHRDRVVIGSDFEDLDEVRRRGQLMMPVDTVLPEELQGEVAGYVNYWPDRDGVIRRAGFQTTPTVAAGVSSRPLGGEEQLLSFAALAATKFDGKIAVPGWDERPLTNYTGPRRTFPQFPVFQVFHDRYWEQNLKGGKVFRDKLVLVGATAGFMQDMHPTPWGMMAGVEVHANAIEMLLEADYLREASRWTRIGLTLASAMCLATGILIWGGPYAVKFGLIVLSGGGGFLIAYSLFATNGWVLVAPHPYVALFGAGLTGLAIQFTSEQVEKRRLRRTFGTFVSPDVAEYLIEHPEDYRDAAVGKRRRCVVVFGDIRGFTAITEKAESPEALVEQLNQYLSAWVECVFEHRGTLDKFVGDAVMAVWGGVHTEGPEADARSAVAAVLAMREKLKELNASWKRAGKPEFAIGVGINSGEAIVGNMGSPGRKLEFTAIGDAVNVAARLEGETRNYGRDVLLSEEVYQLLNDTVDADFLGEIKVRGRERSLTLYALTGWAK